jgi:hypothetical protein
MAGNGIKDGSDERDGWTRARLIPTVGIRGQEEQEKRATSTLLAVMHAVPEFGHALLKELGAPKSPQIETFTEVRCKTLDGRTIIPDGAVVCRRGKKAWTCLVEVKTGSAQLREEQVSGYLDIARERGYDGVLTISNQITGSSDQSPVQVDGRKLKRTSLWHFSWWRIITEAVVQSRHRGVTDPDQAWILGELIAYLDSEASGAGGFEDMGASWISVRKGAHEGVLRANDDEVRDVAARWEQFTQYLCLGLSQDLGRTVTSPRPRNQTAAARVDELCKVLATEGRLDAVLRVPDAVGDLRIRADLRARRLLTSVTVPAPGEGRVKSRLNWLLRELRDAPEDLLLEVDYPSSRQLTGALLSQAREDPNRLLYPLDLTRAPRSFVVTLGRPMGQKRGRAVGSFVSDTRAQTFDFYRDLVQELRAWQPRAPRLPEQPEPDELPQVPTPEPPPFVAAEDREVGSAPDPAADPEPVGPA